MLWAKALEITDISGSLCGENAGSHAMPAVLMVGHVERVGVGEVGASRVQPPAMVYDT